MFIPRLATTYITTLHTHHLLQYFPHCWALWRKANAAMKLSVSNLSYTKVDMIFPFQN